jgi:hypothetical protein
MNAHLELCLSDLLHPTEKSVSLLEALTTSQLDDIEKTLVKIKQKKSKEQQPQPQQNNGKLFLSLLYTSKLTFF